MKKTKTKTVDDGFPKFVKKNTGIQNLPLLAKLF